MTETNNERVGERKKEGNSQEDIETFVMAGQKSENTAKQTVSDMKIFEKKNHFRLKDALASAVPPLACLLYFCCWCRSIRRGLSLRLSRNDLTLGYLKVVKNMTRNFISIERIASVFVTL